MRYFRGTETVHEVDYTVYIKLGEKLCTLILGNMIQLTVPPKSLLTQLECDCGPWYTEITEEEFVEKFNAVQNKIFNP